MHHIQVCSAHPTPKGMQEHEQLTVEHPDIAAIDFEQSENRKHILHVFIFPYLNMVLEN